MPTPKASRPTPWLPRSEQQHLLRTVHAQGPVRDIALVQLVLHTGLRAGELCALTWQDVVLSATRGTLHVQGSPSLRRGGRITRARTVPLNAAARTALRLLGYEVHHGTTRLICTGTRGPLTVRGAELIFAKYARLAGMPDLTLATLRHTFCRNLVEAGADVASIAALAGHTTLESALPYFTPQQQDLEQLVEGLADEA
jgi:integrase/recombinase XerC